MTSTEPSTATSRVLLGLTNIALAGRYGGEAMDMKRRGGREKLAYIERLALSLHDDVAALEARTQVAVPDVAEALREALKGVLGALAFTVQTIDEKDGHHWCSAAYLKGTGHHDPMCAGMLKVQQNARAALTPPTQVAVPDVAELRAALESAAVQAHNAGIAAFGDAHAHSECERWLALLAAPSTQAQTPALPRNARCRCSHDANCELDALEAPALPQDEP